MYRRACAALACTAAMMVAAIHLLGCVFKTPLDCDHALVACGTGGATSSATGSGGGGTGGTPKSCIPGESDGPVAGSCGAFVSSSLGKDTNPGTKQAPFATIGAALSKADVERVYVCAEALSFEEALKVPAGVELYGGLDCKSWAYVGAKIKTRLTAAADAVPLTLTGATKVEDFVITAADAAKDGGSSIAVIADHATAGFARCDLVAGAGKAGLVGAPTPDPIGAMSSNDPAIVGNDGEAACTSASIIPGGAEKENALCSSTNNGPLGGAGGSGHVAYGSQGDPALEMVQTAKGGEGQPITGPWSCATGAGTDGKDGVPGAPGQGAQGPSSIGTLDISGYVSAPGFAAGVGAAGQGGGGGGGAKGKAGCAGPSGGGGGAGGCGGLGGNQGHAGGASIAVVSLGATLSFEQITITTGPGGQGGDGGDGQGGGIGGNGGTGGIPDTGPSPTLTACDGGKGGQGGAGGKGGGGRGGHSIGIAYSGAAAPSTKSVTFAKGIPGKGGAGAADAMHDGDPGLQADLHAFP